MSGGKGSFMIGPGSGSMEFLLPANITNFSFKDETLPGVPASNSQSKEWVEAKIVGVSGHSPWFFIPAKITWTALITWHNLTTERVVTYFAS